MTYLHVETMQVYKTLPACFENVSGLNLLSEGELSAVGFEPLVEVHPELNSYQRYGSSSIELVNSQWTRTRVVLTDSVELVKVNLSKGVTEHRDQLETEGFRFQGKILQSDQRSVSRINTTVQGAQAALMASAPFHVDWKAADNTTLPLDAAGMLGLVVAFVQRGQALHIYANELKAIIEAIDPADPTAMDQLRAINIDEGWPEL